MPRSHTANTVLMKLCPCWVDRIDRVRDTPRKRAVRRRLGGHRSAVINRGTFDARTCTTARFRWPLATLRQASLFDDRPGGEADDAGTDDNPAR